MIVVACFLLLTALGLLEHLASTRARRAVPIRVHVNGTRGKSTVTRLIAAALREGGIPTIAKVTGTAPRLILRDGSERPVARRAPASIREQAWLLRRARREGARALVAECMAVRPDLQSVSEHRIVRATIGVITNVRLDHTEVMGPGAQDIARSLARTIPHGGVLVTGETKFVDILRARCESLGARLVIADDDPPPTGSQYFSSWFADDVAIALAVTRELEIDDEIALRGMRAAVPDAGAVTTGTTIVRGRQVVWMDATAANDPESLDLVAADDPFIPSLSKDEHRDAIVVYNHRDDRPDRLRAFAKDSGTFAGCKTVLLTGDPPALTLMRSVRAMSDAHVRFVRSGRLMAAIGDCLENGVLPGHAGRVIFCGNTRGFKCPFHEEGIRNQESGIRSDCAPES